MEYSKLLKTMRNKDMVHYGGLLYNIHLSKNEFLRWRWQKRTCRVYAHGWEFSSRKLKIALSRFKRLCVFKTTIFTPYC
jgi:hypothetical protein